MNSLRTPLARVRHLGSARDGTDHFIAQRLTAIALVPLLIWLVFSVVSLVGADYATVVAWVRSPVVTILLILLIFVLFYHAHMGMQEVFEDYLHNDVIKALAMVSMKFIVILLTVVTVFAILRIALGGQALV